MRLLLYLALLTSALGAPRGYGGEIEKLDLKRFFSTRVTTGIEGDSAELSKSIEKRAQRRSSKLASAHLKKKALILCSHGGYSHEAAAKTISGLIGDDFVCKTVFPINDYRPFGIKNSENLYNFLFARGWNRTLEFLSGVSMLHFKMRSENFEAFFDRQIESERPDIVISVAPFFNGPALLAAHKKQIPFVLTSLDDNMWIWLANFKKPKGAKFRLVVARRTPQVIEAIEKTGTLPEEVIEMGQLLRPEFQNPLPTREELRKKHRIPKNKRVVLILMGGAGSDVCVAYAKKIAGLNLGAHLIVCTGRYEALAEQIERIPTHRSNSLQAMRFTPDIAELMALSDLMILKPGPSAVFEALAVGKAPLLLDTTIEPIVWEQSNVRYVTDRHIGARVRRLKYLPRLIKRYLFDTQERKEALKALEKIPPNRSCLVIRDIIYELCSSSVKDPLEVNALKASTEHADRKAR